MLDLGFFMVKKAYLLLLISQFLNISDCNDIMELNDIIHSISECTTCDCVNFSENAWAFRSSITEEQLDNFIEAMYSLEYRKYILKEPEAMHLFQNISNKLPFCHPQLLGEW